MIKKIEETIQLQMPRYIQNLCDLVRIPSISFESFDKKYVAESALAVQRLFSEIGFSHIQNLISPTGAPCVYAESLTSPDKPTILLYAHHDVQPPMREALWQSPPFEPTIREDRLYGRGTADDKAGIIIHWAAAQLIREWKGKEGPNLKMIIEGEEECGSSGFEVLLKENATLLKADAVIIADLGNFAKGVPSITTSLRGMSAISITLSATKAPLHSGSWSGPIPDPVQALCHMISSLTDKEGHILIPSFEDSLITPTQEELDSYKSLGMTEETFRREGGVLDSVQLTVPQEEIPIALWRRPSLVVTAIEAGSKNNAGNVLQNTAYARLGIRLAPGMDADTATRQMISFLEQQIPSGLQATIIPEDGANPFTTDTNHPFFQKMTEAMNKAYGTPTKFIGCGASIPGAELFRQILGDIPILLTGVEDPECHAHGENESLYLPDLKHGILAETLFFESLS